MGKLERLEETVYFGDHEIIIREKPHKKTKEFFKFIGGIVKDGFKKSIEDKETVGFAESVIMEKPFEALQIFVPELTEEQFDDATNREIMHAFKIVAKVNGFDFEKLSKNFLAPALKQFQPKKGNPTVAPLAQPMQQ